MSITVKIKTNNNRVNNFSKSTKQKNRRYIKLNCGIDGNVMFSLHSKTAMTICCLNTHNTWRILSPNSACSINILMSKHSFLSTIRLFRHLHRSSVYSSLAVWYIPLKETACQTKCSKHCWCWKQCLLVYLMNINCWLLHVLYWLVGSSGHCVLFELSATVAWHWHFHFLPN